MTSLIVCLGTGKGTWAQAAKLISAQDWEKVYLVGDEFASRFTTDKPSEFIRIESSQPAAKISGTVRAALHGKIKDLEVAVNIASGSGKEHMAVISAILKLGLALRLVDFDSIYTEL